MTTRIPEPIGNADVSNRPTPVAHEVIPIFLFSLPRSGSTLLQRVIAAHPAVGTASEPWLLLPLFSFSLSGGIYAAYGQRVARRALEDFCSGLPGGIKDYVSEVRSLALRLYERHAGASAKYFIDKTPRYHVIAPEIVDTFKNAKFIFLWRNPLSIIASIIETWGRGSWNIYEFEFDLFDGLEGLIQARQRAGDNAICARYEDLVTGDATEWHRLFSGLDLAFEPRYLAEFGDAKLKGRMGDQIGTKLYGSLSREPLDKWRNTLAGPIRKMWCRRYLDWIGDERLAMMGYDRKTLLRELDAALPSFHTLISDCARMLFGLAFKGLEPRMMRDKVRRLGRRQRIYSHS